MEAIDRLVFYQLRFEELWRTYTTLSGGEILFGLPPSDYVAMSKIKKELGLAQKLYQLYNDTVTKVRVINDFIWSELDIQRILSDLAELTSRCLTLPSVLKGWNAYTEIINMIAQINDCCPILESMAHPAMLPRHWERIATVTNHVFTTNPDRFVLGDILRAPLLKHKEEIDDICVSAGRERDINTKLKAVIAEWSARDLSFVNFKTRGELLLNSSHVHVIYRFFFVIYIYIYI